MRPPIRLRASITDTERPAPPSLEAAASPATPPPITTTSRSCAIAFQPDNHTQRYPMVDASWRRKDVQELTMSPPWNKNEAHDPTRSSVTGEQIDRLGRAVSSSYAHLTRLRRFQTLKLQQTFDLTRIYIELAFHDCSGKAKLKQNWPPCSLPFPCATLPAMPRGKAGTKSEPRPKEGDTNKHERPFGLKELADHLGLAPATVSLVMNGSSVADTIAPETKKLIFAAARKFNYRPNFFARCLRTHRSFTIGVLVPEVSEGYNASVLSGIEDDLLQEGYFYFVASHRFRPDLIEEYTQLFLHRSVDGLIVVCTPWNRSLPCPVATISSHHNVKGVNRILLDHDRAAKIALQHLTKLVTRIEENSPSPHLGYKATQELLVSGEPFTALFAFNDICAMGVIRALHEFGLQVPQDVSVLGFDDIESAGYQTLGLTTVQQPLREMGKTAAQLVLRRILRSKEDPESTPVRLLFEPRLVVRETTAVVRRSWTSKKVAKV